MTNGDKVLCIELRSHLYSLSTFRRENMLRKGREVNKIYIEVHKGAGFLDDQFSITEFGKFALSSGRARTGRAKNARHIVVARETLYCSGTNNCLRECGGYGICVTGCAKGKVRGHRCHYRVKLTMRLGHVNSWFVEVTGEHKNRQIIKPPLANDILPALSSSFSSPSPSGLQLIASSKNHSTSFNDCNGDDIKEEGECGIVPVSMIKHEPPDYGSSLAEAEGDLQSSVANVSQSADNSFIDLDRLMEQSKVTKPVSRYTPIKASTLRVNGRGGQSNKINNSYEESNAASCLKVPRYQWTSILNHDEQKSVNYNSTSTSSREMVDESGGLRLPVSIVSNNCSTLPKKYLSSQKEGSNFITSTTNRPVHKRKQGPTIRKVPANSNQMSSYAMSTHGPTMSEPDEFSSQHEQVPTMYYNKQEGAIFLSVNPRADNPAIEPLPQESMTNHVAEETEEDAVLESDSMEYNEDKDLITRVRQLEAHVYQLRNIINKGRDVQNKKTRAQREFDFSKYNTRHVALKITYFGWDYQGFAVQEDTEKTIETALFDALLRTKLIESRETSNYHRCGRTDKGVSALGNVISIDLRSNLLHGPGVIEREGNAVTSRPGDKTTEINYVQILNKVLPAEVRVLAWSPVEPMFSARFSCKKRTYKYVFPAGDLNIEAMNKAAQCLVGEHDFRNLCKMDVGNGVVNYIRTIMSVDVQITNNVNHGYQMCELTIVGIAFLWHQIRCIVAILFLVGQGNEDKEIIDELLDVESHPCKPQYTMAAELPLMLYDCEFKTDELNWIYEEECHKETIHHLQTLWAQYSIKTNMIKNTLDFLEGTPVQTELRLGPWNKVGQPIVDQSDCLIPGNKPTVYRPLLERQKCGSLEERLDHFAKRRRIAKSDVVAAAMKSGGAIGSEKKDSRARSRKTPSPRQIIPATTSQENEDEEIDEQDTNIGPKVQPSTEDQEMAQETTTKEKESHGSKQAEGGKSQDEAENKPNSSDVANQSAGFIPDVSDHVEEQEMMTCPTAREENT